MPPRPLPARVRLAGQSVVLEPLHPRHAAELWRAARDADEADWAHLAFGPFPEEAAMARHVAALASVHDPMVWAARPVATGEVSGWIGFEEMRPADAAIGLGPVWYAPRMRRTRAGTEAFFLLLRLAAEDLGYRRIAWRCDAASAPARRAAERLGFRYEGLLRADRVVRGRARDTAVYSLLAAEWPRARDALRAWLDPANFAPDGTARQGLASLRNAPEPGASPVCWLGETAPDGTLP